MHIAAEGTNSRTGQNLAYIVASKARIRPPLKDNTRTLQLDSQQKACSNPGQIITSSSCYTLQGTFSKGTTRDIGMPDHLCMVAGLHSKDLISDALTLVALPSSPHGSHCHDDQVTQLWLCL